MRICAIQALTLAAVAGATAAPGAATAKFKSPVAIVDASLDTRPYLPQLKVAGVAVIGRYLGRCPQWAGKRLIDNGAQQDAGSEVNEIRRAGLGVLSIYQYLSSSPLKFEGKTEVEQEVIRDGVRQKVKTVVNLPVADCSRPAETANSVDLEAQLDGESAVAQARALGQPSGTAIYFGIDFEFDKADAALAAKVLSYIGTTSRIVKQAGFRFGAYASGDLLFMVQPLKHEQGPLRGKPLVDLFWLSASRSYAGSVAFYNSRQWHLMQTWTDIKWFMESDAGGCTDGLELDSDIQNARYAGTDIGLWSAAGHYVVPAARTRGVFNNHRFVCNGIALLLAEPRTGAAPATGGNCGAHFVDCDNPRGSPAIEADPRPRACLAEPVWIGRSKGAFVQVDHAGSGRPAGWTRGDNLTPTLSTRPEYIFERDLRRATVCPR